MKAKIEVNQGDRYGKLVIIKEVEQHLGRRAFLCKCDCGNETKSTLKILRSGDKKSCGCIQKDFVSKLKMKHNLHHLPEYKVWKGMKTRCSNPKSKGYNSYGGRGITVYPLWIESFEEFYNYLGPRPEGMSLDRIDVNGNYEPNNVRWADAITQANNKRKRV